MRAFTIQVRDNGRPFRGWTVYTRTLEEAKNEAERAVNRDWPMKEFTITPGKGHR